MPYFNVEAAKRDGLTDAQINQIMKERGLTAGNDAGFSKFTTQPQQTMQQPQQQGLTGDSLIDGILGLGKSILQPIGTAFGNTGKRALELGNQTQRLVTDKAYRDLFMGKEISEEDAKRISQQSAGKFLTDEELLPQNLIKQGLKDSAVIGSLAVPGGGATIGGVLGRGALSGGLYGYGASEKGKELEGATGGAIGGAATAGLMKVLSPLLGKTVSKTNGKQQIEKEIAKLTSQADDPIAQETASQLRGVLNSASETFDPVYQKASPAIKSYLSAFTVPTKLGKNLKPQQTAQEMLKYGLTGELDEIGNKAARVTGDEGVLTKLQRSVIGRAKQEVDVGSAMSTVRDSLDQIAELTPSEEKRVLGAIRKMLPKGTNPDSANALDVFDSVKSLEKLGHQYLGHSTYLTGNIKNEQIGNVYLQVAESLKDVLDKEVKSGNLIKESLTPGILDSIKQISPKLADDLASVNNLSGLRKLQAPFVRIQRMIDLTNDASSSSFQNLAGNVKGLAKAVPSVTDPLAFLKPVLSSASTNTKAAGVMDKLLPKTKQSVGQSVEEILAPFVEKANAGDEAAARTVQQVMEATASNQAPKGLGFLNPVMDNLKSGGVPGAMATQGLASDNTQIDMPVDNTQTSILESPDTQDSGFGIPQITPELLQIARMSMTEGNFKKLEDIYNLQQGSGGIKKTEAEQIKSDAVSLAKDAYKDLLDNPKLDVGLISGPKQALLGKLGMADQPSLDFLTKVANLRGLIVKARGGTALSVTELDMLNKYLPKESDSKQELETKLKGLVESFGGK